MNSNFMAKHIELAPNYHSQPNWLPINHFLVGFYFYFLHSVYHMINMYGKKRFFEWNKCFLGYTQRHTQTKTHTVTNTSINIFAKFCVGNCIFFSKIDYVRLRQNPYFIVVLVELGNCCCSASSYVQKWNSNISIQQSRSHGQRANVCRNFIQKVAVLKENALSLWDSVRKNFFFFFANPYQYTALPKYGMSVVSKACG